MSDGRCGAPRTRPVIGEQAVLHALVDGLVPLRTVVNAEGIRLQMGVDGVEKTPSVGLLQELLQGGLSAKEEGPP